MKLLLTHLKRYRKILIGTLALATVSQVFSLLDPQIFRLIIDNYANRIGELAAPEFFKGVGLLLLGVVGVALVSRVAKNFQDYYVNVITQRVGAGLYAQGVKHSFSLPYRLFEDQRSGELLQKLQKARQDSQNFITSSINILFLSVIGILFVLTYAFTVNWLIGIFYCLTIPTLGLTSYLISRKIKQAQANIVKQSADLAGSTTETLRNVELVKSMGLENQETIKLNQVNDQLLNLELTKVKLIRRLGFIQGTLINALRSSIMLLMLWLMWQHQISFGEFFSLLFYSFFIFNPLAELGTVTTNFQEVRASLEQLQLVLQMPPEPKPRKPSRLASLTKIEFKEVGFSYSSSAIHAVSQINLQIQPGKTVALVGPSGSGKSTLVKLLVGLYQPTTGQIIINGLDSAQINYDDLRQRVGYVSQDTQLFAGTIRENLLFVNPEAQDDDCLAALKAAEATSIIDRGGQGLDTRIGESGIKLSGGEKQRLSIARALLRHPELIIFDEATSSLDSITEAAITKTIKGIITERPNLMTIIIAHRLSTVAGADQIYVLAKGKIVEQGQHQSLLKNPGLYAALWRQQQAIAA